MVGKSQKILRQNKEEVLVIMHLTGFLEKVDRVHIDNSKPINKCFFSFIFAITTIDTTTMLSILFHLFLIPIPASPSKGPRPLERTKNVLP